MAVVNMKRAGGHAKKVQQRSPGFQGWNTTDAEEMERRRWRGLTDIVSVEPLEPEHEYFGTFRVRSGGSASYDVEIRSLTAGENSCACADWQVNGLGTCKHIEGVLDRLRRKGKRAFEAASRWGNPRLEIFPAADGSCRVLARPPAGRKDAEAALAALCDADGAVSGDPLDATVTARNAIAPLPEIVIRESRQLEPRLDEERRRRRRIAAREQFLADVAAGTATLDVLRATLLPYQVEGMLHLAFGERVLLADEMGSARRSRRSPRWNCSAACAASSASWWCFRRRSRPSGRTRSAGSATCPQRTVSGPRADRLRQYEAQSMFTLVNYEQVLIDRQDINRIVQPDVVILDEAQRIKNWHTKTAAAVKELRSPYAFVLTGTPLENRIDEVYSIVQYLDPRILGPLFRFNREFYVLDERGRPADYKNLTALRERLAPVMLRRRKDEVEEQLPGRTVDTFFVAMAEEQRLRYADYEAPASRLIAQAQRRPLTKEEFDRLQQLLACMRMVVRHTVHPGPGVPRVAEARRTRDHPDGPARRSRVEGHRVLGMGAHAGTGARTGPAHGVRFCVAHRIGAAGQAAGRDQAIQERPVVPAVPVNRFRQRRAEPAGGQRGGDLDLPWNPAKLEQRIARAWRKHQMRTVTVVNLVCEDSIDIDPASSGSEAGFGGWRIDGRGDIAALKMPSGRAAMIERMAAFLTPTPPPAPEPAPDPAQRFMAEIADRLNASVLLVEQRRRDDGTAATVVVLDGSAAGEEHQFLAEAAGGRSSINRVR